MTGSNLSHYQRLETCFAGTAPDRTPVALWRHFPVDDQTPDGLAAATIHFQEEFDFDLVKVTPSSSFCLRDWGVEDEWRGNPEGTRDYTRRVIQSPEDWQHLPGLNPHAGHLGAQLSALRLITAHFGDTVPVLQTIFSPLSQAKNLAGGDLLLAHMRQYPDAVAAGLKIISQTTADFIDASIQSGVHGLFFAVQHAQYGLLSEAEFLQFGEIFDRPLLERAAILPFNMVHLHGTQVMFEIVARYPAGCINWHDRDTRPNLKRAGELYPGVRCGGLSRWQQMVLGNPDGVSAEARQAIADCAGERLILGTGCVLPITAPFGNILSARQAVEARA